MLQWFIAPIVAFVISLIIFQISLWVMLSVDEQQVKRRGPSYISALFGLTSFMITWFACSNGAGKGQLSNSMQWLLSVVIGLSVAYVMHVAFQLFPSILDRNLASLDFLVDAKQTNTLVQPLASGPISALEAGGASDVATADDTGRAVDVFAEKGGVMTEEVSTIHANAKPYLPAAEKMFGSAQAFTACFAAYSHGANDVSNEVAPFAAIWATFQAKHVPDSKHGVDMWIYVYCGGAIAIGLMIWGWRVMQTLGRDITKMTPARGFNIELAYSLASLIAAAEGWPVSTTQLAVGAICGVGLMSGQGAAGINVKLLVKIFFSWVLTPVITGALAALVFVILNH